VVPHMLPGGSAVMQTFCLLLLAEYFMGLAGQPSPAMDSLWCCTVVMATLPQYSPMSSTLCQRLPTHSSQAVSTALLLEPLGFRRCPLPKKGWAMCHALLGGKCVMQGHAQ
jgi:hypothetical protein